MKCLPMATMLARVVALACISWLALPAEAALPAKATVLASVNAVNNYWINGHANTGDEKWANSVYHIGNLSAYSVSQTAKYVNYSQSHAEKNNWLINGGTFIAHADYQALGQVYLRLTSDATKLANTKSQTDTYFSSSTYDKKWTWVDAIFMQSPVFTQLGNLYGNSGGHDYHTQLAQMFDYAQNGLKLYDASGSKLWFRDTKYLYPAAQSPNGKRILWSRGNGWVFAALASNLELLPATAPSYSTYKTLFVNMAAALRTRQRSDGFWNSNLDDPNHFGGPETSGTAAFTYGMAIGIRKGWLDKATYQPILEKAWNGLSKTAVQSSGFLGYVQPVGQAPAATDASKTADFGVGLFLMAGSEVWKIAP